MNKLNVALVAGGYSGEYAISVKTAVTIEKNLDSALYNVFKIIIDRNAWLYTDASGTNYEVNRKDFTLDLPHGCISFDVAFIAVHGTPGEDGKLQGYFDMLSLPYTSCNAIVAGLTFNKIFCNRVVAQSGIVNVAKSLHVLKDRPISAEKIQAELGLPVFVKPAEGGSSLATTKVKKWEDLPAALTSVWQIESQAMIEAYVKGREFSIGVYRTEGQLKALPLTEIISSKEFFDYEAKYTSGITNEVTPAVVTESVSTEIASKAKAIYDLLNCKGICRIDFILEEESNDIYFLEINTIPGQSDNSIVPQQVQAAGMTLSTFYTSLIREALKSS